MSNLKVGDVCEITEIAMPEKFRGMECVITAAMKWYDDICEPTTLYPDPGNYYEIRLQGEQWCRYAKPFELRLKRPPSWDEWIFDSHHIHEGEHA